MRFQSTIAKVHHRKDPNPNPNPIRNPNPKPRIFPIADLCDGGPAATLSECTLNTPPD